MKQIPSDLKAAVDLINSYNRQPGIDPDLAIIDECSQCDVFFVSLPADRAFRIKQNKPSLCRNCARLIQVQNRKDRQAAYLKRKKAQGDSKEE